MTPIVKRLSPPTRLGIGAALLLLAGAAGGAGAVSMTRPAIEMAPTVATPIARLAQASGIVNVRGRVAEIYGDRVVVQDGSGRTLVDVGRDGADRLARGSAVMVQGRYDDGQLRASYLVDPQGRIEAVGRRPHGPRPGHDGPRPGHDGPPPPPPGGPNAPPPPAGGPGAPPPPAAGPDGAPTSGTNAMPPPPSGAAAPATGGAAIAGPAAPVTTPPAASAPRR